MRIHPLKLYKQSLLLLLLHGYTPGFGTVMIIRVTVPSLPRPGRPCLVGLPGTHP